MSIQSIVAALPRPSIAASFNGNYLEEVVPGYYTEKVEGRGAISVSIDEYESSAYNGSIFRQKKDKAKDIIVTFGLAADTIQQLRLMEDKVKFYITNPNTQISFDDEPNRYRVGNVSELEFTEEDTEGSDGYFEQGTMTIRLSDPYKYSSIEKSYTADSDGLISFNYEGYRKAYPIFRVTASGSLDGFAIMNSNGKIVQIGNMDTTASGTSLNFVSGDVIDVDIKSASVKVNDTKKDGLGAIGNDFLALTIQNGSNSFKCTYQSGSSKPEFKILYREVYV